MHALQQSLRSWLSVGLLIVGLNGGLGKAAEGALPREESAIQRIIRGETTVADASWWGFDPVDATAALQAAIDSGASRVVVPLMPSPWVVQPIRLRSNLELQFDPGVVVLARAGAFLGGGDCLFRAVDATNIHVRGHGAVLRMRKLDYQQPPYPRAEWRMGLSFTGCKGITVEGLRIESTGGDGIYIGSSPRNRWCEDVVIRDCTAHDNHRQGLSVISAVNLLVERCRFSHTSGTAPEAGIDFEPDHEDERLVNCLVRECILESNNGSGILVYLKPMTGRSQPVSIRFEQCHVRMGAWGRGLPGSEPDSRVDAIAGGSGIAVGKVRDDGPGGTIEFVRCTTENTGREAVRLFDTSAKSIRVRFESCRFVNSWTAHHRAYGGPRSPILIRSQEADFCSHPGGVEFAECTVHDTIEAAVIRFEDDHQKLRVHWVSGQIRARMKGTSTARLHPPGEQISLNLIDLGGAEPKTP